MNSQNEQILTYMKSGRSLTALDALQFFGCFRLASRIHDLKKQGHAIESKPFITREKKTVSIYYLRGFVDIGFVVGMAIICFVIIGGWWALGAMILRAN